MPNVIALAKFVMSRWLAAISALILIAVAGWEIVATRVYATSVPDDNAWDDAAGFVRSRYQPGDLIVFAPRWIDPVGRLHLGDLISLDTASRMDSAKYRRIWLVSIRAALAPEVAPLNPVIRESFGGVTASLYEQVPATLVSDLTTALATAKIVGGAARGDLVEVGFEPHRCVVATVAANTPVEMQFPRLQLGRAFVGYFGVADVFTRRDRREPVELTVKIADRVTTSAIAPIDKWVRFEAITTPGVADVTLTIRWQLADTSQRRPTRQVCVAAEARL